MQKILLKIICLLTKLLFFVEYNDFLRKLNNPKKEQDKLLKEILKDLQKTQFGQKFKIAGKENYDEFKNKIPLQTYNSLEPFLNEQSDNIFFETTSGSSGANKKIPYNQKLLNSFSGLFRIWIFNILTTCIKPKTGKVFLSTSSTTDNYDLDYLDNFSHYFIKQFLVEVKFTEPNLLDNLSKSLILEEELEIISIWSPTYLLSILQHIEQNKVQFSSYLNDSRKELLLREQIDWQELWPSLQFISCWMDGTSKTSYDILRNYFPTVTFQGKGLLATEAPMTVPIKCNKENKTLYLPLINDVFYEFKDAQGQILRLHELNKDEKYELIITQKSGLIRYQIGDFVTVTDFYNQTPSLKFLGKSNSISDYTGEKLSEENVIKVLKDIFEQHTSNTFISISFNNKDKKYFYTVYVDQRIKPQMDFDCLNQRIDKQLQGFYHYRLSRIHGQLGSLEIKVEENLKEKFFKFLQSYQATGFGDIKDKYLISDIKMANAFATYLQDMKLSYQSQFYELKK